MPIIRVARLAVVTALLAGGLAPVARAADTSGSAATQAGPEEQRFRRRAKSQEPPERVAPAIEDNTPPYLEPPFGPEGRVFAVKTIRVEGGPLIPQDQVRRFVTPYEDRELTLADLRRLAAELTAWLRGQGFVTSKVYIPPQEVTAGAVTIQILEGRVGEIRVEGTTHTEPGTLLRRMRSRPGALLDFRTLQWDLVHLNATIDRRVAAVLVPGKTTGTTDVLLTVAESSPIHVGYLANNAGTKFTGRFRQGVRLGHNNLTGHDDQLVVRTEISERTNFLGTSASYLLPVGVSGRTVGVDASYAAVTLDRQFRPHDVEGQATVLGITWAEPLWRTAHWETEWVTGFDGKQVRSREDGGDRGKDDLRVLRLGPNLLQQDAQSRSIVTTELGLGFSRFLGSSRKVDPSASRAQSGGQFVRLTIAGGRLQRLWRSVELLVRGSWQWTNDRLPPAETFQIGGDGTVRGYPQGEFLGDYGYTATVELRAPIPLAMVPHVLRGPRAKSPLTLVGFWDNGAAFLRKPLQNEEEKKRLTGVGVGLRWSWSPYTSAVLDVGVPVGDTSVEEDRVRIYYSINAGF